MAKKFSLNGLSPYPHIKVTREKFPRFLATRNLQDKEADYFGAFLTKTAARILIDFLNRTFRLRSCDIELDGSFPVPCTQYFRKRCLAPCVKDLCSPEEHAAAAEALCIFLKNDRTGFRKYVDRMITSLSECAKFEKAVFWRDMLHAVENYWKNPRWNVWLDDAVDTYQVERDVGRIYVYLITTRGRHTLGKHVFVVERSADEAVDPILAGIIDELYQHYAPREIRVGSDFAGRRELAQTLSGRFGREVKIVVREAKEETRTATLAFSKSRSDAALDEVKHSTSPIEIEENLKIAFGLERLPQWIEAIDISHISGTGMAGAAALWRNGKLGKHGYGFLLLRAEDEVSAIGAFISERYLKEPRPDLILIDGGKSQLAAALKANKALRSGADLASAVKPPGKHSNVSHFLTQEGLRIEFDPADPAHLLLQLLRDEAHELANYVHAEFRDARHFYEATGTQPLIVPIRFSDIDGSADDLRPIAARPPVEVRDRKRSRSRGLYRPSKRA
jgi:excinuclease ABC subunit C